MAISVVPPSESVRFDAEDRHHPGKGVQQLHTEEDEERPQDQGADDPPLEDLRLVESLHLKVGKNHDEDEQVVHRERLLDKVAGEKLQPLPTPQVVVDADIEQQRQHDPDDGPRKGFAERYFVALPAQSQIDGDHDDHEQPESAPEYDMLVHENSLSG